MFHHEEFAHNWEFSEEMGRHRGLWVSLVPFGFVLFFSSALIGVPSALGWSKEGHVMTCQIAQVKFEIQFQSVKQERTSLGQHHNTILVFDK